MHDEGSERCTRKVRAIHDKGSERQEARATRGPSDHWGKTKCCF